MPLFNPDMIIVIRNMKWLCKDSEWNQAWHHITFMMLVYGHKIAYFCLFPGPV